MVLIHVHRFPNKHPPHTHNPPQTKSPIPRATCPNDINHPHAIHPNDTVGAVPVCPPERPRSGVSIQKNTRIVRGDERWMRPCMATRAGTQAPPLPISVIHSRAIPPTTSTTHAQSTQTKRVNNPHNTRGRKCIAHSRPHSLK